MTQLRTKQSREVNPVGLRIGYARKSKQDQELALQLDALSKAGCSTIYSEQVSRAGPKREKNGTPELDACLKALRPGDSLVVWRLDRLGGSVRQLIEIVEGLSARGVEFVSLCENIDTTTATGKMFFNIVAAIAQYERELLIERTMAGLEAARVRGKVGGRKRLELPPSKERQAMALMDDRTLSMAEIEKLTGLSRTTLYRRHKEHKAAKAAKAKRNEK
jgi:DNA invertase Pin-like site-specific DNA recombinase